MPRPPKMPAGFFCHSIRSVKMALHLLVLGSRGDE
jgi:hypothetical protein